MMENDAMVMEQGDGQPAGEGTAEMAQPTSRWIFIRFSSGGFLR